MTWLTYLKGNEYEVLPSNVGLQDTALIGAIERYNEMLVERKRLLRTSTENNPTIRIWIRVSVL